MGAGFRESRWLAAAAGVALAASAWASVPARLTMRQGSTLWLEGRSTLHGFKSTAATLVVEAPLAAPVDATGADLVPALMKSLSGLKVTVPVAGLRSGKDGLDKNMRKALRAGEHPEITFHLEPGTATATAAGDRVRVRTKGTLTVAGQARPVELDVEAAATPEGVVVTGAEPLLMTDFGIKPPTFMLGAMKTDDKVTVHFRLVLALEQKEGEAR